MENWKEQLNEWKSELMRPKSNDLLIHITDSSKKVCPIQYNQDETEIEVQINTQLNAILNENSKLKKQLGINTLCVSNLVLKWSMNDKVLNSPVYLIPAQVKIDKLNQKVNLQLADDNILNPFLEKLIQLKFDVSLQEIVDGSKLPEGWEVASASYLGNFHYHRHTILKDIDFYIENPDSINSNLGAFFLGTPLKNSDLKCDLNHQVFPWDEDQKCIIKSLSEGENIKVSGPPGTGKSQLIANAVFQHAMAGKWVLVSSEKEAAMEVVLSKMKQSMLNDFCLFVGDALNDKTNVIRSLQQVWSVLEKHKKNDGLTNKIEIYRQQLKSFDRKLERLKQIPKSPHKLSVNFTQLPSETPDFAQWNEAKKAFEQLNFLYKEWKNKDITRSGFKFLKPKLFLAKTSLIQLEKEIQHILKTIIEIREKKLFSNELITVEDMEKCFRIAIHAQILQQDLFVLHPEIFEDNSKQNQQFKKLSAKYLKTSEQTKSLQTDLIQGVTADEWKILNEAFDVAKKWSTTFRKAKKRVKTLFQMNHFYLPEVKKKVQTQLKLCELAQKKSKIKQDLIALGIRNPETDIALIDNLLIQSKKMDKGLLETLKTTPGGQLKKIAELNGTLGQIAHFFERNFSFSKITKIDGTLEQIKDEMSFFTAHFQLSNYLSKEFISTFRFVQKTEKWEQIEEIIALSNLKKIQTLQPDLFNYTGEDFSKEMEQLIGNMKPYFHAEAQLFYKYRAEQFSAYHQLLETPATKLSDYQKNLKQVLRRGRSLLIKEFGKRKRHISIHELLNSDAKYWLKLLKPIWLISPLQITAVLPNTKSSVDLLIMDEASQIPFVHALPAIYRSKQICMVGDEMQMNPSSFFTSGSNEQEDVLSRFGFHANSYDLRYHYRSLHPSLIAFSNRFFYNGELNVFSETAKQQNQGVFFHEVKNAVYEERANISEARSLLKWLNESLDRFEKGDQIMIATFSEQQQNCIAKLLQNEFPKLIQLVENEEIEFKTLEHIQGDECEHLIISLAYGKNENGDFLQNFGPINQSGGDKRLNVLFSRARKSIHLFASVSSSDFKLSENRGADLLRQFFVMLEEKNLLASNTETVLEKWGIDYTIKNDTIAIANSNHSNLTGLQLLTLKNVLQQRGWRVKFTFDKDKLIGKF